VSVNDPCVSISTGTLSPDLRVNYAFGMILGLDEFLQEQQYFLEKGRLHERALHGFGTVYGLQVTTAPAPDVPADYTIAVAPGMAIDQWGREVVVRSAQCARLGAWLGAQEQAEPGTIAKNMGVSGEFTVYVVISYAQCADDLVPLPGQPCSSSSQTMAAARWRDAWNIDLRWTPPPMPAWDTDRRLARLLNTVQIVPGLDPALSSETDIIQAILSLPADVSAGPDDLWPPGAWPPDSPPSSPPGQARYRLPAETAADALDRIFTVWVTQVRPLLSPGLTQPPDNSDPAVLLASITFTLGPVTSPPGPDPAIATCGAPDDHGRPYVLHTRLLQELRMLAEPGTAVAAAQELATVTNDVDAQGRPILTAWFHLDQPVALTAPVQVRSRSGAQGSFLPSTPADPSGAAPQFSDVWVLTPEGNFPAIQNDQVGVSFEPGSVLVGNLATTLETALAQGLDLLGTTTAGDVVVFETVQVPAPVPPAPPVPVREFVTITPVTATLPAEELMFELWFHIQPEWPAPRVTVGGLIAQTITLVEERTGQVGRGATATQQAPPTSNVWQATFGLKRLTVPGYLRFVFPATRITVTAQGPGGTEKLTLAQWMEQAGVTFLNWDPAEQTITAFLRLAGPQ
jgi:hypothetical protein